MDWKQTIKRWRDLPPQEQARIRLARLPRKVARSMAFEGEPVEPTARHLDPACLDTPPELSNRVSPH